MTWDITNSMFKTIASSRFKENVERQLGAKRTNVPSMLFNTIWRYKFLRGCACFGRSQISMAVLSERGLLLNNE